MANAVENKISEGINSALETVVNSREEKSIIVKIRFQASAT